MKQFYYASALIIVILSLFSGCDLVNQNQNNGPAVTPTGTDLYINEVFTLSPDKYYAYSWIELYNPTNHKIRWAEITHPATGFAVGTDGTIMKTVDDGATWHSQSSGTAKRINSLGFVFPDTGFGVGDGGTVIRTADSGRTWTPVSGIPTGANLNAFEIPYGIDVPDAPFLKFKQNSRTAWAVGDSGTIIRTINRGLTWTKQISGTKQNLHAFYFADFTNLWVAGDSGIILHSTNLGTQWVKSTLGRIENMNAITMMMNTDSVWAVGDNGLIYQSTGTAPFIIQNSGVSVALRDIIFIRRGRGWAVGDNGVIINTRDGGAHWSTQHSGGARLNSIRMADTSGRMWVIGNGGTILHSTDFGDTWQTQTSSTTADLSSGNFPPLSKVVQNYYAMSFRSVRKEYLFDPLNPRKTNYNYYVNVDTGYTIWNPYVQGVQFRGPFPNASGGLPAPVQPHSFVIVDNDSNSFNDHQKLGPGDTDVRHISVGYYASASGGIFNSGIHLVKWDLMPAGEIILTKYHDEFSFVLFPPPFGLQPVVTAHDSTIVDVMRYGGYRPAIDNMPNNYPAPAIPEWSSLARYSDDVGYANPNEINTAKSFYLTTDPIPGWYSQRRKP